MKTKEEIYNKYLESLRVKIIAKYDELGLRASGKFERGLEKEIKGDTLTMWSEKHAIFMEHGRSSGGFPVVSEIEEWIEVKDSLPIEFKENKRRFAFIIARKIAREGITVPNTYNKGEVISSVVKDFLADDLRKMIEELGDIYSRKAQSDVVELFKQAAA
ncbi:hypothetical protein ACFSTE_13275 [Aquimarina hainanensis]|uniref:Uncharacterized protein n=1 Tax=Aquimarina hainanensis TaxID=1578017 RepID=A0ABW5N858_9FLAO